MTLAPIDKNEISVVSMLEKAKTWLSTAVETTGPEEIAAAKAQIRTAEVYSRELRLSKDIQDDATEMVRRAEYALGKSIRKGQEEGTIAKQGSIGGVPPNAQTRGRLQGAISRPIDLASHGELHGKHGGDGVLALADNATPQEFDAALTEARQEGNLSRANVVRKVKGETKPGHMTREQRADLIEELAAQGYSSRQMPNKVGVSEETVRQIARDFGVEIPADRVVGRTRRINSAQVVENTATALEGLLVGLALIDFDEVDAAVAQQWTDSIKKSLRELNEFGRNVKRVAGQ